MYDLYDDQGRKIGKAVRDYTPELMAIAIIIGIGIVVLPFWAWYAIGNNTWRYHNLRIKVASIFAIVVCASGVLWASEISEAALIGGALVIFGGWAIAYYIGKARQKTKSP